MKYLVGLVLLLGFMISPVHAQSNNPSLIIDNIEIPWFEFNTVSRDSAIIELPKDHSTSWQVTIDNDLLYANPDGNAVLRFYDVELSEKFIEVGMGPQPHYNFWVAVQLPEDEGYVVIHDRPERGWSPSAKTIVSYTDRAGLTVNNGVRIVVTNLDIGLFAIDSYSTHGMKGSTDPPSTNSGIMKVEFLSGDPAENVFALFPFYVTAGVGTLAGILYLTKRRSSS